MTFENLLVEDAGHVRTITINRPKQLNALNAAILDEIQRAAWSFGPTTRVVVVTGAGDRAFVAGADIEAMKTMSAAEAEQFSRRGHDAFNAISSLPVPVIAAVNGFALGGGLELALACDFIYAADTAKLGLVETNLGLIPGFGGTVRLPRRVGAAMAAELIFSAASISADEAMRIGLVNRVFPAASLLSETRKIAETIATKGPKAIELVKRLLNDDDEAVVSSQREQTAFGRAFATKDHDEGIAAFLEKRAASFKNE